MTATVLAVRGVVNNLLDPVSLSPVSGGADGLGLLLALYELEVPLDSAARAEARALPLEDEALQALVLKDAARLTVQGGPVKENDPATLIVVPAAATPAPPRRSSSPSQKERDSDASGARARTLHFRVYGRAHANSTGVKLPVSGGDEELELLGCCSLLASELTRVAEGGLSGAGGSIELNLTHSTSPLSSQTLRQSGASLVLQVRPAMEEEASEQRVFERLMELADAPALRKLPKRVHAQEGHGRALIACTLRVDNLPSDVALLGGDGDEDDAAASPVPAPAVDDDSVWLAALFERDLRTGLMTLQGVTPWTRADVRHSSNNADVDGEEAGPRISVRFPGSIRVDYFTGEAQRFQVSLYRFRGAQLRQAFEQAASVSAQAGGAATSVPPALVALLREEERVGSTSDEMQLDWLGLESQLTQRMRTAAATAAAQGQGAGQGKEHSTPAAPTSAASTRAALSSLGARLFSPPGRPERMYLSLPLAHDLSPRQDGALKALGACVTLGVDVAATTLLRGDEKADSGNEAAENATRAIVEQDHPREAAAKERRRASMRPGRTHTATATAVPPPTIAEGATVPASAAAVAPATSATDATAAADLLSANQAQLDKALQLLASSSTLVPPAAAPAAASAAAPVEAGYTFALPADAAPEAAEVVLPLETDAAALASPAVTAQLVDMMSGGQCFLVFDATGTSADDGSSAAATAAQAKSPEVMRLFHRLDPADPSSPGHLYLCPADVDPLLLSDAAVVELAEQSGGSVNLLRVSDVYLGASSPAFHSPAAYRALQSLPPHARQTDAEGDDGVSFSLVAAPTSESPDLPPSRSLHCMARSAARRAAWILAIMRVIGSDEEEAAQAEAQTEQPSQSRQPAPTAANALLAGGNSDADSDNGEDDFDLGFDDDAPPLP